MFLTLAAADIRRFPFKPIIDDHLPALSAGVVVEMISTGSRLAKKATFASGVASKKVTPDIFKDALKAALFAADGKSKSRYSFELSALASASYSDMRSLICDMSLPSYSFPS